MSDESKSPSSSAASASSPEPKSSDAASSSSVGGESRPGKSSRESIGGAKDVHYGYFSSVRSREYKSGWDAIWGAKDAAGGGSDGSAPIRVGMALDELPEEARRSLVEAARRKLAPVDYDDRDRAGAVSWRIECEIGR